MTFKKPRGCFPDTDKGTEDYNKQYEEPDETDDFDFHTSEIEDWFTGDDFDE